MYPNQNYQNNLGTSGHRPTSSFNYLTNYQQPTSSHYLPPSTTGTLHPNHHILQPTMVGFVPPPPHPAPMSMMAPQLNHMQMPIYQYQQPVVQNVAPVQNEVTGGINSVLEYDLPNMSTFLSWCSFGMLKQTRNPSKDFEKLINSVLVATRLPKSTIITSLEYMNQRFSKQSINFLTENEIFIKLIVSLILGNKFNDDNTFTNRSWCGATGLTIEVLNSEEKTWLNEINWQLNVVNFESNIITLEECWKTWLDKYSTTKSNSNLHLPMEPTSPISFNSIPSSPISISDYYSPNTSPMKESIWSTKNIQHQHQLPQVPQQQPQAPQPHHQLQPNPYHPQNIQQNNIWSYTPYSNELVPPIHYLNSNFVGYTNPYYTFNMASC